MATLTGMTGIGNFLFLYELGRAVNVSQSQGWNGESYFFQETYYYRGQTNLRTRLEVEGADFEYVDGTLYGRIDTMRVLTSTGSVISTITGLDVDFQTFQTDLAAVSRGDRETATNLAQMVHSEIDLFVASRPDDINSFAQFNYGGDYRADTYFLARKFQLNITDFSETKTIDVIGTNGFERLVLSNAWTNSTRIVDLNSPQLKFGNFRVNHTDIDEFRVYGITPFTLLGRDDWDDVIEVRVPGRGTYEGAVIDGGDGDDKILGSHGGDHIIGGTGNDSVSGDGGQDLVYLNEGDDYYSDKGGMPTEGADTIYGGAGNDTITSGRDGDEIYGGTGADDIAATRGSDSIYGEEGADTLDGGEDADFLDGGADNDVILGDIGSDTIEGGDGDDSIDGGLDADVISGGRGHDTIIGGRHNDTIDGSYGADVIEGGLDADVIAGGNGNDVIRGGGQEDTIDGGKGHDRIFGGRQKDEIRGGNHDDWIDGGKGNDKIFGDVGNDTINGGTGHDRLWGGRDADTFVFAGPDIGLDHIRDYTTGVDTLVFDKALWNEDLTVSELLDRFGDDSATWVKFYFSDSSSVVLHGVTSFAGIEDDILII